LALVGGGWAFLVNVALLIPLFTLAGALRRPTTWPRDSVAQAATVDSEFASGMV
jgi:hypothetical protein